jgi:hypothetical protein
MAPFFYPPVRVFGCLRSGLLQSDMNLLADNIRAIRATDEVRRLQQYLSALESDREV